MSNKSLMFAAAAVAGAAAVAAFLLRPRPKRGSGATWTCEYLVVGAGVAGSAAAYHLGISGATGVTVLEVGSVGLGDGKGVPLVPHAVLREGDRDSMMTQGTDSNGAPSWIFRDAKCSGTAVFNSPTNAIKMIVSIFPCSSDSFVANHGEDGARNYLRLAKEGVELEKEIARKVLDDPETQLTCKGSLYVCLEADVVEFEKEYHNFVRFGSVPGVDIELWEKKKTQNYAGVDFHLGIFFPRDAAIDSTSYCRGLLKHAVATGRVTVKENASPVVKVDTIDGKAVTTLQDGTTITSKYVVLATGGLFTETNLAGILTPCYSYLTSMPIPTGSPSKGETKRQAFRLEYPATANFFSWGFTHDWCLTKGHLRCSGEDHFSALKAPRAIERCQSMATWTGERYPYLAPSAKPGAYEARYGVYSETPDHMPLVGIPHPDSRVCYLLGCNAWGQASLSFASSLVPSLLGLREFTPSQKDSLKILDIKRFALLPCVLGNPR